MKYLKILLIATLLFFSKLIYAVQPDSIVIRDNGWSFRNSYQYIYILINNGNKFVLYQTYMHVTNHKGDKEVKTRRKIETVSFDKITSLTNSLKDTGYSKLLPKNFGYDRNWIQANTEKLYSYLKDENEGWTTQQMSFVKQEISDFDNYQPAINKVIGREGVSIIFKDGGITFSAIFYYKNKDSIVVNANENPLGMPWQIDSANSYNPTIPLLFSKILPNNTSYNKARFGDTKNLIKELTKQVYDDKCGEKMKDLSAIVYHKEIDELKIKYNVLNASEYTYSDGYIWEDKQVFQIVLHDSSMVNNLNIALYLTKEGNTLYSRDSILNKGKELVKTIQNIPFIRTYLLADSRRKLTIKFENGASINNKVIDGFNKTEKEWKEYAEDVKRWHWMDSMKLDSGMNEIEALKVSKELDCGCDFRLDNNILRKGIFFEIHDEETNDWSTWIVLPDSTIILWWIEGEGFSNYTYEELGTNGRGVQYVCKKFTANGELKKE